MLILPDIFESVFRCSSLVSFRDISRLREPFLAKFDFYMQGNVVRAQKLFFRFQFTLKLWYELKFLKWNSNRCDASGDCSDCVYRSAVEVCWVDWFVLCSCLG
jgi:hypothetical protein